MSVTLNNKRILVTRPEHQADHLCELISNAGGKSILFPTIEIKPILNSEALCRCFTIINDYDFVIFVSRNAVRTVFEHYLQADLLSSNLSGQTQLLAIGSGTATALAEISMTDVLHAGVQADSESLLQLPELQKDLVKNKKILIVRGVGGREFLAESLKARGAFVDYAEVYERCLPDYEVQAGNEIWKHDEEPDAIIVSSNEGLNNLLELTLEEDRKQLLNTPLVVMSERSVDLAKKLGFDEEINVAREKTDEGLLSAVLELVGDE